MDKWPVTFIIIAALIGIGIGLLGLEPGRPYNEGCGSSLGWPHRRSIHPSSAVHCTSPGLCFNCCFCHGHVVSIVVSIMTYVFIPPTVKLTHLILYTDLSVRLAKLLALQLVYMFSLPSVLQ